MTYPRLVESFRATHVSQAVDTAVRPESKRNVVAHTVILSVAVWQMVVGLRRRDAAAGGLVLLVLYMTMVTVFLRRPNPRYNLPFLPVLFVYTAQGALMLIKRFIIGE